MQNLFGMFALKQVYHVSSCLIYIFLFTKYVRLKRVRWDKFELVNLPVYICICKKKFLRLILRILLDYSSVTLYTGFLLRLTKLTSQPFLSFEFQFRVFMKYFIKSANKYHGGNNIGLLFGKSTKKNISFNWCLYFIDYALSKIYIYVMMIANCPKF